jgi:hypothetical protein
MEYKQISYNGFCGNFLDWNIIDEKHFHDLSDKKYYNEYTLQPPSGTKLILIICHYYQKKRVQIDFYYNDKFIPSQFVLGTKQITQILLPHQDDSTKYLIPINTTIRNYNQHFNESNIRNLINFFYN